MANSDNPAKGAAFERLVQQWLATEGLRERRRSEGLVIKLRQRNTRDT